VTGILCVNAGRSRDGWFLLRRGPTPFPEPAGALLTIRLVRGFDSNAVLDPTLLENLLFTHGRGIYLMKTLMDEVSFEEGGAVVMMRKKSNANSSEQRKL
jgi:hypothetical protein